ncbi:hypothetical protein MLD63_09090 [Paracoccus sp. TK19116]|uniref:ATP synthase F0 subunit B n=1 Tax=Paracoccus albicereus TaxID=2922394 RepID=A0ABT1MQK5_9RHOB|nr:hypothetical protein [Paracoccus albicereus]MCQ0970577.1 hypothetical protein [Paracoccus albicereus]
MNETPYAETKRGHVDWASILAGAAIAAGASIVFTGFTAAIGLGSVSAEEGEGLGTFALILVGLFAFIAMVAVYALGGYVAGRMRSRSSASEDETEARDGIHGLTVWAIGMILGGILAAGAVSTGLRTAGNAAGTAVEAAGSAVGGVAQGAGQLAGGVVGGVGQVAGGAISGVGQLAGGAASAVAGSGEGGAQGGNPLDYVTDRLLRSEAAAPDQFSNDQIRSEVGNILSTVLRTGEVPDEDLDYLRSALAARTELTPAQIDQRVEQAVTQAQDLRAEAQQRLEEARAQAEEAVAAAEARAQELRDEAEQRLQEAQAKAVEVAERARSGAVWSALFLAVSSLVAAVAAWMGAIKGGHDRDAGKMWAGFSRRR